MSFCLNSIFTDNMVLQREVPVTVWGKARPWSQVIATFCGQTRKATATEAGCWEITLESMTASSVPATIHVVARDPDGTEELQVCNNVLIGDIWVCSGQSNMEWPVSLSKDAEREIASANFAQIRLLSVPKRTAETPSDEIEASPWLVCSPETICQSTAGYPFGFSAVAYFFGRQLHQQLGVPIGLINASVGGTCAEAWTSREGLLSVPELCEIWKNYERDRPLLAQKKSEWRRKVSEIKVRTNDTENKGFALGYASQERPPGQCQTMELPTNWLRNGLDFNGVVWFRKNLEIPAAWMEYPLKLSLGAIDKSDITYFNGVEVGRLTMLDRDDAWSVPRVYVVPAALLRAGTNILAVRVHSDKRDAGMMGPSQLMTLSCPSAADSKAMPLAGTWEYLVEANYGKVASPPEPLGPGNNNTPCGLFNGMIAPLTRFAVRGVIWYQGEANVDRATQYRELFPALIRDWRKQWNDNNLPFHFVQLANFMETLAEPGESAWAELREAQTIALGLPHTGMVVSIDVGEAGDIHPRNKQDVGRRLAASVLHEVFGRAEILPSGPMFRKAVREGHALRIYFDCKGSALFCPEKTVQGFAIAGEDGKFVWASALIDGDTVLLSNPAIPAPQFARYAWASNPVCNLYNMAGLPAVPFRPHT